MYYSYFLINSILNTIVHYFNFIYNNSIYYIIIRLIKSYILI